MKILGIHIGRRKKPDQAEAAPKSPSFWKKVIARLKKNRIAMIAWRVLVILSLVALFADFLAYEKPFVATYKDETYFPIFNDYLEQLGLYKWDKELIHAEWIQMDRRGELTSAFWPPIRYSGSQLDMNNQRSLSPFGKQNVSNWKEWHFLGTDRDGRDVLSGLIHGTRISLTIGVVAMGIAAFIGILLGAIAGFYGDNRLQITRIGIVFLIIGLVLGYFYGFTVRSYALKEAIVEGGFSTIGQFLLSLIIMVGIAGLFVLLAKPLQRIPFFGKKHYLWLDILLSRLIEVWGSVPVFLLIITIGALTEEKSIFLLMVIIGIFGWPGIARYMRGEMLRTRNQMYIEAARSLGYSEFKILIRHAVPNSLAPVLVVLAFGIAGAISLEAALSFLGVGVPDDVITWGKLLKEARNSVSSWWLSLFPGLAIFITVASLNLLGEGLRDALDPKILDE